MPGQLLGVTVEPPEPPGGPDQVQRRLRLIVLDQPGQRGAEVVAAYLQPAEPGQLSGTVQLGVGRLGQGREIGSMPVMRVLPVPAFPQAFQGVLPDGIEQAEPGLILAGLHLDQAAVHQRAQRLYHTAWLVGLVGGCRVAADRRHGRQAEAPDEHSQPGEQGLLIGREQAKAPVERVAQGPLPFGQVTRSGGQQRPSGHRAGPAAPAGAAAGSGRRPARWPAAGRPAGGRSRRRPGCCAWSARSPGLRRGPGPRTGEPRRSLERRGVPGRAGRRDGKRRHREFVLAAEPEHGAAGHQDHQARARGQQVGDDGSAGGHLLEVIQDQQELLGPQVRHQVADQPVA